MSEYITHVAVHDDSRNLALFADSTMAELKQSLQHNLRAGRLGAVTNKGDKYSIDLLQESKKAWPSAVAERMLAFFFGWRSHIAADRQFKTLFRLLEPEFYVTKKAEGPNDVSLYHDLFILRELYNSGKLSPFAENMLAPNHPSRHIEEIFVGLWQNSLLSLHSFTNQERQPESWFKQFLSYRQTFNIDVERYVAEYNNIDTNKMRQVVETHRFYNHFDPLIRLTQSLRQGNPDRSIELAAALEAAKTQSHYARALRRNWLYLQDTAAFWQGDIDVAELQKRFEVNKPHTSPEVSNALKNPKRRMELLQKWHESGGQE